MRKEILVTKTPSNPNQPSPFGTTALVRDVNCLGVAASNAAKAFNAAYPENAKFFRKEFDSGVVEPGRLLVYDRGSDATPRFIFSLPTKIHWKAPVRPDVLSAGIDNLLEACLQRQIHLLEAHRFDTSPASPNWDDVKLAFLTSFARVPHTRLRFIENIRQPAKSVTIFTDGGADPNPGVGGYGVVLRFGESVRELSQGFRQTTSNRMELMAAIVGLEALKEPCNVHLYSDSRYLIDPVSTGTLFRWQAKNWKNNKVKNIDLWKRFLRVYARHNVEMLWVKGHSGVADNERCDRLAAQAMKSDDLLSDEGYRTTTSATKGPPLTGTPGSPPNNAPGNPSSKRGPKPKRIGDPCRNCATPLIRRETKKHKPSSNYYYEWYLFCPNCKRLYHLQEAKVYRS